ncbi:hypothetical protein AMTR_s00017p00241550 [Amborella trichopoda]|uniref:Uncharacterized protein n=1 Tax=Amborella trichopoda TaxID=13333 RepID=W1PL37_AMBTC|nr:hypothetical protein AMTR_s00017p00241550 [Amborella trichopoda]
MGGCFLALLKFIGPLAQCNFPKFAIEEDCVSKIFADSIRKVVTGGCIAAEQNLILNQELLLEYVDWFASWEQKNPTLHFFKGPQ